MLFSSVISVVVERVATFRSYRTSRRQLSTLSEKELAELGLRKRPGGSFERRR